MKATKKMLLRAGVFAGLAASTVSAAWAADAPLRIPAFTAYLDPDSGARISSRRGVTGWTDPATRIVWFGRLTHGGSVDAAVDLRLPAGSESKLRLSVGDKSQTTVVRGAGTNVVVTASFGNLDLAGAGYRVRLMAKGENVVAGDFGNEGTGGHSHLKFHWKTGEVQRFLVTAQPTNETFTVYSGYYFHPDQRTWKLISAWQAPKDGGWLHRLHSFSENFVGNNGQLQRKARYGNQWIRTDGGQWFELTAAHFSHDGTGRSDRLDRFMGVEDGRFFLSHGGFLDESTRSGKSFSRTPSAGPPEIKIPAP